MCVVVIFSQRVAMEVNVSLYPGSNLRVSIGGGASTVDLSLVRAAMSK